MRARLTKSLLNSAVFNAPILRYLNSTRYTPVTHLELPPQLDQEKHSPFSGRKDQVHLLLSDASISCSALHRPPDAHADTWLLAAQGPPQQQQESKLMGELQGRQQESTVTVVCNPKGQGISSGLHLIVCILAAGSVARPILLGPTTYHLCCSVKTPLHAWCTNA